MKYGHDQMAPRLRGMGLLVESVKHSSEEVKAEGIPVLVLPLIHFGESDLINMAFLLDVQFGRVSFYSKLTSFRQQR